MNKLVRALYVYDVNMELKPYADNGVVVTFKHDKTKLCVRFTIGEFDVSDNLNPVQSYLLKRLDDFMMEVRRVGRNC